MNADNETFVVDVAIWKHKEIAMDPDKKAQIIVQSKAQSKAQVGTLIFDQVPIEVLAKYSNFSNVFSVENIAKLLKHTKINDHTIKLEEGKQLSFDLIYSLKPVDLKTLKTYIKTNLANSFIRFSKSSVGALILFDRKLDKSLHLCVNY